MAFVRNIFLLFFYVFSLVFMPAHHLLECHEGCTCSASACHLNDAPGEDQESSHSHSKPHDPSHCPICQLAHTPLLATVPLIVPVPKATPVRISVLVFHEPVVPIVRRLPFSRGPPA